MTDTDKLREYSELGFVLIPYGDFWSLVNRITDMVDVPLQVQIGHILKGWVALLRELQPQLFEEHPLIPNPNYEGHDNEAEA